MGYMNSSRDTNIEPCALCAEPLIENFIFIQDDDKAHQSCVFRNVVGGAHHILKLCACYGGTLPSDPLGLTRRQSGVAAVNAWESTKPTDSARSKVAIKVRRAVLHDPCDGQPRPIRRPHDGPPTIWLVYEKPLDFPDEFVSRSHNTEKKRTGAIIHAHRLAKLRQLLRDQGLYRIEHGAADDADVIESWL
jgi:hypothetical protein